MKPLRSMYAVLIALGVLAALMLGALAAQAAPQANTYIVAGINDPVPSACSPMIGGYACPSLRSAVIAANANPGSTIELSHGAVYHLTIAPSGNDDATTGDLNITANTTFNFGNVICMSNCGATIQGGAGWSDRLIYIDPNAHVDAFLLTLRDGHASTNIGGGAVYMDQGSALTLTNSIITGNSARGGGGILLDRSTLILNNVQVLSNTTSVAGAGAGIWNSGGVVSITDSLIRGNQGDAFGSGIYSEISGTLNLSHTIVSHNSSTQDGGGIYLESGWATLINSQIIMNTSDGSTTNGGGLAIEPVVGSAHLTLTNVSIVSNTATYNGGGINIEPNVNAGGPVYVTINGGVINSNTARFGGGLQYNPYLCAGTCSGRLYISGTLVMSNTATGVGGGGLELNSGAYTTTIVNSVIGNNHVLDADYGVGGGIASNGALSILNTWIYSNTAAAAGGGLYNSGGPVSVADSSIDHNTAGGKYNDLTTGGGGVFNYGSLTLDNSTITANHVITGSGGGLLNRSMATIRDSAISANSVVASAAGILNAGIMTLDNVNVNDNTAEYDAGVQNRGILTLQGGTVSGNIASDGTAGLINWTGTLYATGLVISNNQDLNGYGSGFINEFSAWLTDTQIINNTTPNGWGAGIINYVQSAHLTLAHVSILSNTAAVAAGIYNNEGTITATASTIAHNVATGGPGGGILNATYSGEGALSLDGSSVFDNRASTQGGGIYNSHILTLTNSTLSGNRAGDSGGGLFNDAGYDPNPTVDLNNVTIANNQADSNNDGVGKGGGVAVLTGTVSLRNTLIGANTDLSSQSPDCSGVLTSDRYNLVQNTTGCTLSGNLVGNVTGQNPRLGPLQNNGGETWTQALLSGSPAINKGNPTAPGSGLAACMAFDQRGVARPVGPACDIGAFEAGAALFKIYLPLVMR